MRTHMTLCTSRAEFLTCLSKRHMLATKVAYFPLKSYEKVGGSIRLHSIMLD
jgi:hypothetical protein